MKVKISKAGVDVIAKAVGEHMDSDLFDFLRVGKAQEGEREEYKKWLNIHGRLLSLWLAADGGIGCARM